jgi:integrase
MESEKERIRAGASGGRLRDARNQRNWRGRSRARGIPGPARKGQEGYPLLDSLGIERGGLHSFRHTNSTLMDQLGAPFKVRQQRLGHSDVALTLDVYTHVVSADDVRLAEQLGGILRPNAPKSKEEGVAPGGQPLVN